MARPKSSVPTSQTYLQRFRSFEAGVCPYCYANRATLIERATKKGIVKGYRGHCLKCNAENNFTKPEVIERTKE